MSIRATVKLRDRPLPIQRDLQTLLNPGGTAKFIVVLDPPKNTLGRQAYQGIVPLEGDSIAEALEQYMLRSEQLDTRIWLAADTEHCTGLLLQRLPLQGGNQQAEVSSAHETWDRTQRLAETLSTKEMLEATQDDLLHRLFWEEMLLIFEAKPIAWKCSCTRERVADMLKMLGRNEVQDILETQGKIEVACEFCGQPYLFDGVDSALLFQPLVPGSGKSIH
jgi:molecular chaperone Hsp33